MIENQIAIFIDTNVFQKKGLNFDARNEIIKQYKELIKCKNLKNVCVSVIDNEIKKHIEQKKEDSKKCIKKHCKWIYELLDETIIEEKLNKDLVDYEKFKLDCKTVDIDLKDINPEIVMKRYFNVQYPFETSKPDEFKDAFFLETIYRYAKIHNAYTSFIVVTNDNGIKKAIDNQKNRKIIYFDSIEALMDTMIKFPEKSKNLVFDYIKKCNFSEQLKRIIKIDISDIEEEYIDIQSYECCGIYFPKIIKVSSEKIVIACDMFICLNGDFLCLDYDNSYYSSEEDDYLYKQYIQKDYLGYVCQTIVEVNIQDEKYVGAKIVDISEIEISYKSFTDNNIFGI